MYHDVAPQVAPGDEGLPAERTPELFAVCVDRHVDLQGPRLGEAFPAVDAAVTLLSRVDALVALQVAGIGEAFAAERADERLLARVDPHVGLQVLQAGQSLAAVGAHERPPPAAVLTAPPVPPDELSLCQLFPGWALRLVCRLRRPLLAALESCRLLVLCCTQTHLTDGEREAAAAGVC